MSQYDEFVAMSDSLMLGLPHVLDDSDVARVDDIVNQLAITLGERPDAWDGAGNVSLLIAESLIPEGGPWTASAADIRANTIVCCFIMVRLMAHPMMQPVLKKWEAESS